MLTIFTLIAGLGIGTSACLAFMLYREIRKGESLDRERMLWANKVLVRQGQMPVFTPEMLGEERPEAVHQAPMQVKSPFRAGHEKLRREVEESKGVKLTAEAREIIEAAAEARRAAG